MNDLTKEPVKAISFSHTKKKLTDGELALLALMKKKIEQSESIRPDEVKAIYLQRVQLHAKMYDSHLRYDRENSEWVSGQRDYTEDEITQKANQWFKSCLGNLILKEKLVVIPVIDID